MIDFSQFLGCADTMQERAIACAIVGGVFLLLFAILGIIALSERRR